jgi:hypothetical protein
MMPPKRRKDRSQPAKYIIDRAPDKSWIAILRLRKRARTRLRLSYAGRVEECHISIIEAGEGPIDRCPLEDRGCRFRERD